MAEFRDLGERGEVGRIQMRGFREEGELAAVQFVGEEQPIHQAVEPLLGVYAHQGDGGIARLRGSPSPVQPDERRCQPLTPAALVDGSTIAPGLATLHGEVQGRPA